jgi:hypothetical protein
VDRWDKFCRCQDRLVFHEQWTKVVLYQFCPWKTSQWHWVYKILFRCVGCRLVWCSLLGITQCFMSSRGKNRVKIKKVKCLMSGELLPGLKKYYENWVWKLILFYIDIYFITHFLSITVMLMIESSLVKYYTPVSSHIL